MLTDILMVFAGVVLTVGTALFVASEFSLVALDPTTVQSRAAAGDRSAAGIAKTLSRLSIHLSGAQIGITLTTILLGYTTQTAIARLTDHGLQEVGVSAALATASGLVVALVITNGYSMLFGELVPKNLALSQTLAVARIVSPLQRVCTCLFMPLIWVLNGSANAVLRLLGFTPSAHLSSARSASELAALVRQSAAEGTLDVSTAAMFTKSVKMGNLCAADVMRDRQRADMLEASATVSDLLDAADRTGHSRFPVIGEDADDILGIAHLRPAISVPFEKRGEVPVTSQSIMTEVLKVPETVALAPLLLELRGEGSQMAIVVDEYGGTSGVVTLEDVIEEITGEIADEHDPRRRGVRLGEKVGSWVVTGTLRPDEIAEHTKVRLPDEGPYDTIGGLIMMRLGAIPQVGDEVSVNGYRLRVAQMDGRRVLTVEIWQDK